jgi:hypothetical protein
MNLWSKRQGRALTGRITRGGTAVKKLFGVLAAVLLALVVLAPPAEARCWWNGYRWHCHHRHHYYSRHWYPYRYYGYYSNPYYYRPYYRPYYYRPYYAYACIFPFCW